MQAVQVQATVPGWVGCTVVGEGSQASETIYWYGMGGGVPGVGCLSTWDYLVWYPMVLPWGTGYQSQREGQTTWITCGWSIGDAISLRTKDMFRIAQTS